jgi:pilus assembly protein Flp/PilA
MLQFVKTWLETREEGQGLVEYGMIIALVAVVAIGAVTALGTGVDGALTGIVGALS